MIRFPTCYALFYFALIKKFPYWWIFFHIKRILSHVTPGVPPRKTDGFSWYTVHATRPERVKTWSEAKATYFSVVWTVRKIILVDFVSTMIVIIQSFKILCLSTQAFKVSSHTNYTLWNQPGYSTFDLDLYVIVTNLSTHGSYESNHISLVLYSTISCVLNLWFFIYFIVTWKKKIPLEEK